MGDDPKTVEQNFRVKIQERLRYFFACYNCKSFPYFDEIYKCDQDLHLICVDCHDQGCPCNPKSQLLRSEFTEELRSILVTQCKNPDDSYYRKKRIECNIQLPPVELAQHEKECEFRLVHCPLSKSHRVPYNDFLEHFKKEHK